MTTDPSPFSIGARSFPGFIPFIPSSPKKRRKKSMSEFASGLFAPFIVTEIFTTLGATFLTIGAKLLPSFMSRVNGLLSTWTCNGAFCVPLLFSPPFTAKPVAMVSAEPPSKSMLHTSGFSDFLVIIYKSWFAVHYDPSEVTNALLEHYKLVREAFGGWEMKSGSPSGSRFALRPDSHENCKINTRDVCAVRGFDLARRGASLSDQRRHHRAVSRFGHD